MKRALVMGWYRHCNLGDEAFRPALAGILGENVELEFIDFVPNEVNDYDALVIGGGSFLDVPLNTPLRAEQVKVPIGFLGVGIHSYLHPDNLEWLRAAKIIVSRNKTDIDEVTTGADLVFARDLFRASERSLEDAGRRRLLVLPNGFLVANSESPAWRLRAAESFEMHMARLLRSYELTGWDVSIQPMLAEPGPIRTVFDDRVAGARLMTMVNPERIEVGTAALSESALFEEIERADLVVSARFHGCVLACMAGVAFVGIGAHEKFKSFFADRGWRNYVDFHHFDAEVFEEARSAVPSLAELELATAEGRQRWSELAPVVRKALCLEE